MCDPPPEISDIYCGPQSYGARMIMIPSVQRQNNLMVPCNIISYNSETQYQAILNSYGVNVDLHGNDVREPVRKNTQSIENQQEDEDDVYCTPKRQRIDDIIDCDSPEVQIINSPKKEPISPVTVHSSPNGSPVQNLTLRKSNNEPKTTVNHDTNKSEFSGWVGHVKPVPGIPRQAGSKREEVLKAARSLFSKRTRTLYHWIYPCTPKTKLKASVAAAWDTLSVAEKDFYISQVLGRFGVPAGSLMVNPQLGGFKTMSLTPNSSSNSSPSSDESSFDPSRVLMSQDDVAWGSFTNTSDQQSAASNSSSRKRRRSSYNNRKMNPLQGNPEDEETEILKQIRQAALDEDFADDPELSKEFEQFSWALHVSNTQ